MAINSNYSNYLSLKIPEMQLPTPQHLRKVSVDFVSAVIAWDDVGGEVGFGVERSVNSGGPFVEIGRTASNVTAYTDNNVTQGTTYYYRVRALAI